MPKFLDDVILTGVGPYQTNPSTGLYEPSDCNLSQIIKQGTSVYAYPRALCTDLMGNISWKALGNSQITSLTLSVSFTLGNAGTNFPSYYPNQSNQDSYTLQWPSTIIIKTPIQVTYPFYSLVQGTSLTQFFSTMVSNKVTRLDIDAKTGNLAWNCINSALSGHQNHHGTIMLSYLNFSSYTSSNEKVKLYFVSGSNPIGSYYEFTVSNTSTNTEGELTGTVQAATVENLGVIS